MVAHFRKHYFIKVTKRILRRFFFLQGMPTAINTEGEIQQVKLPALLSGAKQWPDNIKYHLEHRVINQHPERVEFIASGQV